MSDPAVVRFCNEELRPIADNIFAAWQRAKVVNQDYVAKDIGTLINNDGVNNVITDGSALDGRTPITGGDVFSFITAMNALIAFIEGGAVTQADRSGVITKPHVTNPF